MVLFLFNLATVDKILKERREKYNRVKWISEEKVMENDINVS